jgi:hypothetical protein
MCLFVFTYMYLDYAVVVLVSNSLLFVRVFPEVSTALLASQHETITDPLASSLTTQDNNRPSRLAFRLAEPRWHRPGDDGCKQKGFAFAYFFC